MRDNNCVALVVGSSGITGSNLITHLLQDKRFIKLYGVCAKTPYHRPERTYHAIQCNVHELDDTKRNLGPLSNEVTHLFYVAWVKKDTEEEQEAYNHQMFKNVIDVLMASPDSALEQVVLQNGTKYYGCHLHAFRIPAIEDQERHTAPNFYFRNLDYLQQLQKEKNPKWRYLETRPSTIIGWTKYAQMNLGTSLAIYAAIQKELNGSFIFPGKQWKNTVDVTDVDMLSRFEIWACFNPSARANQSFNVVNGDTFKWKDMWYKLGKFCKFPEDKIGIQTHDIEKEMNSENIKQTWKNMIQKYNLTNADEDLNRIGTWWFVNAELGREWDVVSSMDKARKFGWTETVDSEKAFYNLFIKLQQENIIPKTTSIA